MESHALTDINVCCIIAHRSPPVDQQNSVSTVETDQPEDPAVGAKIVLPSSDAREYYMSTVCRVISHIVNPEGMILFCIS